MPHLENGDMKSYVLFFLIFCNTKLIIHVYRMISLSISLSFVSFVGDVSSQDFHSFAKAENFFRLAHLKNIEVDVACYTPILDCFQMWRSIASTMTSSKDRIGFLSILLAINISGES